ncbi:hypothetical protein C7S15_7220 [Burkholderia cepacia]|nr:hypothetical protein [Burkholderia cepacia]
MHRFQWNYLPDIRPGSSMRERRAIHPPPPARRRAHVPHVVHREAGSTRAQCPPPGSAISISTGS